MRPPKLPRPSCGRAVNSGRLFVTSFRLGNLSALANDPHIDASPHVPQREEDSNLVGGAGGGGRRWGGGVVAAVG